VLRTELFQTFAALENNVEANLEASALARSMVDEATTPNCAKVCKLVKTTQKCKNNKLQQNI
jgi:hypothetical protein